LGIEKQPIGSARMLILDAYATVLAVRAFCAAFVFVLAL